MLLEEDALVLIQNSTEKEMNDEQESEEEHDEEEGRQASSCGRHLELIETTFDIISAKLAQNYDTNSLRYAGTFILD